MTRLSVNPPYVAFSKSILYLPGNTFPPVNSKRDFVRRYKVGEFGNASPTWDGLLDWRRDNPEDTPQLFHIRNRVAGAWHRYDTRWDELEYWWDYAHTLGFKDADLYISAMAPTPLTVIQGEVMQHYDGLYFYYSLVKNKAMRDALGTNAREASGSLATHLLQHYMDPRSYDWLQVLLDRYPGHVVEFTTYSQKWGTLPGYRTVFWEVRNY